MFVHQTITPFRRNIVLLQRDSVFKVIFRESANNIVLIVYSEKSIEVNLEKTNMKASHLFKKEPNMIYRL